MQYRNIEYTITATAREEYEYYRQIRQTISDV